MRYQGLAKKALGSPKGNRTKGERRAMSKSKRIRVKRKGGFGSARKAC